MVGWSRRMAACPWPSRCLARWRGPRSTLSPSCYQRQRSSAPVECRRVPCPGRPRAEEPSGNARHALCLGSPALVQLDIPDCPTGLSPREPKTAHGARFRWVPRGWARSRWHSTAPDSPPRHGAPVTGWKRPPGSRAPCYLETILAPPALAKGPRPALARRRPPGPRGPCSRCRRGLAHRRKRARTRRGEAQLGADGRRYDVEGDRDALHPLAGRPALHVEARPGAGGTGTCTSTPWPNEEHEDWPTSTPSAAARRLRPQGRGPPAQRRRGRGAPPRRLDRGPRPARPCALREAIVGAHGPSPRRERSEAPSRRPPRRPPRAAPPHVEARPEAGDARCEAGDVLHRVAPPCQGEPLDALAERGARAQLFAEDELEAQGSRRGSGVSKAGGGASPARLVPSAASDAPLPSPVPRDRVPRALIGLPPRGLRRATGLEQEPGSFGTSAPRSRARLRSRLVRPPRCSGSARHGRTGPPSRRPRRRTSSGLHRSMRLQLPRPDHD